MNYGQVKNKVLMLLNQYSVAGKLVASSYNNQQDYLNRIPMLVNDAMEEIATTYRKIPAVMDLTVLERESLGNLTRFALPDDFFQFKTGDTMVVTNDGRMLHTNKYSLQGKSYLLVPTEELEQDAHYFITYYRHPVRLGDKPADTDELDNEPETHEALAFYAAAFLVIHDDNFVFASLYNKYDDKVTKLGAGISVEMQPMGGDGMSFDGHGIGGLYDGIYDV